MNNILETYARNWLKENISYCTDNQKHIFKRIYSCENLTLNIDTVIDTMPTDQLDNAITKVQRTIDKNKLNEVNND